MNPWTIQHSNGEVQITDGEHVIRWQGSLHGTARRLSLHLALLDEVRAIVESHIERLNNVGNNVSPDKCKEIAGTLTAALTRIDDLDLEGQP